RGSLAQVGAPAEVYERPNSRWVADFIGDVNLIEGRAVAPGRVSTPAGELSVAPGDAMAGATVWVALRPEKLKLGGEGLPGEVIAIGYLGDTSHYQVRLDSGPVVTAAVANVPGLPRPSLHARISVSWDPAAALVLTQ